MLQRGGCDVMMLPAAGVGRRRSGRDGGTRSPSIASTRYCTTEFSKSAGTAAGFMLLLLLQNLKRPNHFVCVRLRFA
jgi:hypothetical protein